MSKKQYSPRKQKREKGKVEGEHSKVPNKTPEINKEGEKAEKGGLDETLTSAWSDWQWVNEGWYYYRARRGENGKWQYEFEIPETTATQGESSASAPAIENKGESKDNSVKPPEIAVQDFSTSTVVDGPIYNRSFIPYTDGFIDNGQQTTPSDTTEPASKPSKPLVEGSKEEKEDVKAPEAEKPEEKSVKVVRRERGRGRERKKDSVSEWRESVAKETGSKSGDGDIEKSATKPKKRREKDRHRDRSYYNKPPYSDHYTLSE